MNFLVLGAKLQGIEAIYLGKKAGYYVTVIDCRDDAPGADLADEFIKADIMEWDQVAEYFIKADVIIPVIEDTLVLHKIQTYGDKNGGKIGKKIIFDYKAYELSGSKEKSNELFEKTGIPMPKKYPDCKYPVIVKPDNLSGSANVHIAYCDKEVKKYKNIYSDQNLIIQEYLEGPSYSLEVLGDGEQFYFPLITQVIIDHEFDCKRIASPVNITQEKEKQMFDIAKTLADKIKINGIFDIEVIDSGKTLKVLEIDARMPSQTPISVYKSTGINMIKMLADMKQGKKISCEPAKKIQACLYQQIYVHSKKIEVLGEHIMSQSHSLEIIENFYGADEVITDYKKGCQKWRAIVIIVRDSREAAKAAFINFIDQIKINLELTDWEYIEG